MCIPTVPILNQQGYLPKLYSLPPPNYMFNGKLLQSVLRKIEEKKNMNLTCKYWYLDSGILWETFIAEQYREFILYLLFANRII